MSEATKKITLQTAIDWTKEWRSEESDYNKYNELNAFLIPIQDIQGVLAEMGANPGDDAYVRAYLGVDASVNEEKLIIVGTEKQDDGTYKDLLPVALNKADGNKNSIWDFAKPCPPYCDKNSSLN